MAQQPSVFRSRSNKKKKKNEDRISLLPDCLLHNIMSSLNTKQVVQTCVLSKRWKTVWTCIPTLNFDFMSYPFQASTRNPKLKVRSFNDFISRVLLKHCGSHVIKLSYSDQELVNENQTYLVQFLICYAASHKVGELCINTHDVIDFEYWTDSLSEFKSLNVLKFSCFSLCDEKGNNRGCNETGGLLLPSLRILELGNLCCERLQKKMFAGFPNLKSLVLVDNGCDGCATIFAPKLENFELRSSDISDWFDTTKKIELFTPSLRCVKFENVVPIVKSISDFPCLNKVDIVGDFDDEIMSEKGQDVVELLRVFQNATSITMPLIVTQVLMSVPTSISVNFSFHNLRHLKLEASKTCKKIDLPMNEVQYLLKSPSLKTMVIDLNQDG